MKVTITIKLVNSQFNQDIAMAINDGEESEDNIKYLWEDEFEVKGEITSFKIKNNTTYQLEGYLPDDSKFSYTIPDVTIVECIDVSGNISQFPISKRLIKSTDKTEDAKTKDVLFSILLTDKYEHENPMDGAYILKSDFPKDLV